MNINVKSRRMSLTPEIREYAEDKIGKVAALIDGPTTTVDIELSAERNPSIGNGQVAEVTVFTKGPVIRVREASNDMHAAIDIAADKLERRIKKYRGKLLDKHTNRATLAEVTAEPAVPEEVEPEIVKRKVLTLKPMNTEEAVLQMELLGHDFLVFASADTEMISVLYRRRDGDYGLIEPRVV